MKAILTSLFVILFFTILGAQKPGFTANEFVPTYEREGASFFATNMGYYEGWRDEQLADIAIGNPELGIEGVGVQALRPTLPEWFVEHWGYDIRLDAFEHYKKLGLVDHTLFLQDPSEEHKETESYCEGTTSKLFANMYLDIWDDGTDGTPVNDANFYALYVYKVVSKYKNYVRIWEIWNEPDFVINPPGTTQYTNPADWWDANPEPCRYKLQAPIFHYIRLLRISYEVIKSLDPEAYVAIGGLGYPSFLDAVMRNTDNPTDGSVSEKFPLGGGAYFDVMNYHSYPHIDNSLREWSNAISGFEYFRHSDAAVDGLLQLGGEFKEVLEKHGYDDTTYPRKRWILTETNIPRVKFNDEFIGSDAAQRHFMIKSLVACKKENYLQYHVFNLGEANSLETEFNEFDFMGLYKPLASVGPYQQTKTNGGIAYETTSLLLRKGLYHDDISKELNLPSNIRGAAFVDPLTEEPTYVLWAVTDKDEDETTSAEYSFPADWNINFVEKYEWDYSKTDISSTISSQAIQLTGSPIFLRPAEGFERPTDFAISAHPNPFTDSLVINYDLSKRTTVTIDLFDVAGKLVQTVIEDELQVEGRHQLFLSTANIPVGVYLCRLSTTNKILAQKIIKE